MGQAMRRPLVRPYPKDWFLRTHAYRMFMLRELTSVVIAGYLVYLLWWLHRFNQGGVEGYEALLSFVRHPVSIAMHTIALIAAAWHSITWFNLTPSVMPMRIGEDKIPDVVISIATGFGPWFVLSGFILWATLR